MRSVLITGSNGFIGSYLISHLLHSGNRVSVLNRKLPITKQLNNNLPICAFCYDGSQESIRIALEKSLPDLVIHLASYFVPRHRSEDVDQLIASNLLFGTQLLEMMVHCGICKLINTGTYWQHYKNEVYNPVSLYAATKQAFEDILLFYVKSTLIDAITLKLFDTYGEEDTRPKVLNLLLNAAIKGTELKLSPGEQRLNLVHVQDVINAYGIALDLLLNRSGFQHSCYGVAHAEVFSLQEIAKLVEKVTGTNLKAQWGALPYREREVMEPWSKFELLPGWKAHISLEEGVTQLIIHSR